MREDTFHEHEFQKLTKGLDINRTLNSGRISLPTTLNIVRKFLSAENNVVCQGFSK